MQSGNDDKSDKGSRQKGWGFLLNKLPSFSKKKRRRGLDKTRRQNERKAIDRELDD